MEDRLKVILYRPGEQHQFDFAIWDQLLELAKTFGWHPQGTEAPAGWQDEVRQFNSEAVWSGDYTTGLGETVSAEDAEHLASALAQALDDIPDSPMPDRIVELAREDFDDKTGWAITGIKGNLFELFGGQNKQELIDFIAFC